MENNHIFSTFSAVSFIASVASLILSVGAIALSIVFFRMSNEASRVTTEAARGIAASVERLEKLFDKLYSDTFSMMRDTVSDMRKHMWPAEAPEQADAIEETEKKADEKLSELQNSMEKQIAEVLEKQKLTTDKMGSLTSEMGAIIEHAISRSRLVDVEAREETLRQRVLGAIRRLANAEGKVTVGDIVDRLQHTFPIVNIVGELRKLEAEGRIEFDPQRPGLNPSTMITRRIAPPRVNQGQAFSAPPSSKPPSTPSDTDPTT